MVLPYWEHYVTGLGLGYMPNKAKNWTRPDLKTLMSTKSELLNWCLAKTGFHTIENITFPKA